MANTKYWERRELHDRHAKALDRGSACLRDRISVRISEIMFNAVQNYHKERQCK